MQCDTVIALRLYVKIDCYSMLILFGGLSFGRIGASKSSHVVCLCSFCCLLVACLCLEALQYNSCMNLKYYCTKLHRASLFCISQSHICICTQPILQSTYQMESTICMQILSSHKKKKITQSNKQQGCFCSTEGWLCAYCEHWQLYDAGWKANKEKQQKQKEMCVFVCSHRQHVSLYAAAQINSVLLFFYYSYWNNQIYWPANTHTHTHTHTHIHRSCHALEMPIGSVLYNWFEMQHYLVTYWLHYGHTHTFTFKEKHTLGYTWIYMYRFKHTHTYTEIQYTLAQTLRLLV